MEQDIEQALVEHALLLGGDWAYQNRPFDPSGGYFRASVLFLEPERLTLDAMHRMRGLFQADVMTPENMGTNMAAVQRIIDHFPADLSLTQGSARIRITRRPSIGPLIKSAPYWQQPVTVAWETFV
jgi:hypothetical protein